ncbi:DUF3307 domain-containing protein [Salibaculum griseiflavum]|uniref:DUF3307 domain-containing protein n=1 Tax=Salibaculum griseiflavum TaxID=1914409 RepID=A0A2V1PAN5_9RHOB|nr:DUF3307 domain-containing protein [Salibaculum griseiflavum]PWG18142.1 DUF3307 domain-containing protein [Salibaculum griseiflavum]
MIATFTALLLAHTAADFLMQTGWMVRRKAHPGVLLLHGALVLGTAQLAIGTVTAPALVALAAAHVAIDAIKTYGGFRSLTAFLLDQAAHLATLAAVAVYAPELWANGAWAGQDWLLPVMAVTAGAILALAGGQYAVGILMQPHSPRIRNTGLRDGGRQIGLLERGLIFAFILTSHPIGVGFLIAAKSILRFDTASRDQRSAEYVIIGTLASFGWAILAALATKGLLDSLPPFALPR